MAIYQIYVAGKQRGDDYTNLKLAIQNSEVIARANKRVHLYEIKNGVPGPVIGIWIDGKRTR
jgi:hypothetical protein